LPSRLPSETLADLPPRSRESARGLGLNVGASLTSARNAHVPPAGDEPLPSDPLPLGACGARLAAALLRAD